MTIPDVWVNRAIEELDLQLLGIQGAINKPRKFLWWYMHYKELNYLMEDGGACIFVAEDQEYVDRILPLFDKLSHFKNIVVIDYQGMFMYVHPALIPDRPIEFGVCDFCRICEKCAKKCPSKSIMFGEPTDKTHNISNRAGVKTWHINAETCLGFWADNDTDCSNCIRTCPFNKPPGMLHEGVRWGIHNTPWLNRLFLWGDNLFGYGKRENSDLFWQK